MISERASHRCRGRHPEPAGGVRQRRGPRAAAVLAAALLGTALLGTSLLGGCGLTPLPGLTWVRLPETVAAGTASAPTATGPAGWPAAAAAEAWQLLLPVALPAYLDREAVMVAAGPATLRALPDLRWAEPLREVLPRLLRADLQRQLNTAVFAGAPPEGAPAAARRLRLELTGFEMAADQRSLRLRARWSIADVRASAAVSRGEADFEVGAAADAESVGRAHRQALARLAELIVASARTP